MVAMTEAETVLPTDRPLTIDDLEPLPYNGNRFELDDGVLVVTPPPIAGHQHVIQRLSEILGAARPANFQVLPGLGVQISRVQYRIPDIVVVKAGEVGFKDGSTIKPPALVIEVASPSTAIYDRNRKKELYAGFGIESYWIVKPDLDKPRVTAFELSSGEYRVIAEVSGDEPFSVVKPFACEIVPAALVAGPWES
jgi:Uma2 family endonuclease